MFVNAEFKNMEYVDTNYDNSKVLTKIDGVLFIMNNDDITLNVDGTKVKIKMLDLIKALKDTLDSGEFWLDQIDDIVSDIEADRQELREALEARRNPEVYYG